MVKLLRRVLLFAASCFWCCQATTAVEASDFGIVPDTDKDVTAAFRDALEQCREKGFTRLSLNPGRYDFWPEQAVRREIFVSNTSSEKECPSKVKTLALLLENLHDFTLDGNGAELVFHGKQTMVAIVHSENITLQNLTVTCVRPGGSELTVEKVDKGSVTMRFTPDSWHRIDSAGRLELVGEGWTTEHPHCIEFNPDSEHLVYSTHWNELHAGKAEELEPGVVRFEVPTAETFTVGNILTVRDRYRDEVGILNLESENVLFKNMDIHYLHAIGVISQFCRNVTFDNVRCEPRKGSGRILASSADFFHFSGCSGKVTVRNCRFSGAQDDPVNVHGTYLRIEEQPSPRQLRVRFMHHQTYGMQAFWPGDTISFVERATLFTDSMATVTEVLRINDREILLSLDRDVPTGVVPQEYCIENLSRTPQVEIRGNRFALTSTRGVLVTTPRKVVIADNEFYKTGMSAILISGDASSWYESGAVKDVTIEGNTFIDCAYNSSPGNSVITIDPSVKKEHPLRPVHSNVTVRNNKFFCPDRKPVYARSTGNLQVE